MRLTNIALDYFKKYVDREIRQTIGKYHYKKPFQDWKVTNPKLKYYYSEDRPWTQNAYQEAVQNARRRMPLLEPMPEWKIFIGDRVELLAGKDKGKQGTIQRIIKERNWCFVEGLNCVHYLANRTEHYHGDLLKEQKPLVINEEVQLVDPYDNKPTDVVWRYNEEGERVRVSVRTGRIIPVLEYGNKYHEDLVDAKTYKISEKDTPEKELNKVTFKPKLMTFESDIMEQMGIKEDRKPGKTYWY